MAEPFDPGAGGSDSPSPISYDSFERIPVATPTSAVAPKITGPGGGGAPAKTAPPPPAVREPSRARRLIDAQAKERALIERERALEQHEARWLSPAQRDAIAIREYEQEALEHVTANASLYPVLNELGLSGEVSAYQRAFFERHGKVLTHSEAAEVCEQYYAGLARRASEAQRRAPRPERPSTGGMSAGPARQWNDRLDDQSRYERALALLSGVGSTRRR